MITENIEGFTEYSINPDWAKDREPGLSAMIRLKDESEHIRQSLDSIVSWFDEIIICLQPCADDTPEIVKAYESDKIKIYEYPFESQPNGPCHDSHDEGSVYDRSYFYNWSLAKTTKTHVSKWDGDMVAMDWLGYTAKELLTRYDVVRCQGIDICGDWKMSPHHLTANEPRFFRVTEETFYQQGKFCEVFTKHHADGISISKPGYLHFKWAKSLNSATKAWPDNWKEIDHFNRIYKNKAQPIEEYTGEIPSVLKE